MPQAPMTQTPATGVQAITKIHPSRFAYTKLYFAAILLITIFLALQFVSLPAAVMSYRAYFYSLLAFVVLAVAIAELRRLLDSYTITNNMIIERRGILRISESSISVDKISSTTIVQTVFDRLLDIGSIDIWSVGGADEPEITIEKIPNVRQAKQMLDQLAQRR